MEYLPAVAVYGDARSLTTRIPSNISDSSRGGYDQHVSSQAHYVLLGYFWQSGQIFWVMAEIGIYLENMALITHKCPGKSAQIGSANVQSRFS